MMTSNYCTTLGNLEHVGALQGRAETTSVNAKEALPAVIVSEVDNGHDLINNWLVLIDYNDWFMIAVRYCVRGGHDLIDYWDQVGKWKCHIEIYPFECLIWNICILQHGCNIMRENLNANELF